MLMDISSSPQDEPNKMSGKRVGSDLSLWALIFSNLITIAWALIEGWSLAIIIWVYWCQSVVIGILWFFKILTLKEFSTEGFEINDRSVKPTQGTKIQTAFFFLAHYGFFHVGYAVFLCAQFKPAIIWPILLMATVFAVYQSFSFFYNKKWVDKRKPNIGAVMFFPYARIIPMHLTIIFGGTMASGSLGRNTTLVMFMLLKTGADAIMHIVEQRGFADKPAKKKGKKY